MEQTGLKKGTMFELSSILKKAIDGAGFSENEVEPLKKNFVVEVPADLNHGDFATNLAMVGAKILKMAPEKVAQKILKEVCLDGTSFERFEFVKPGFINFFLKNDWFKQMVLKIKQKGAEFGRLNLGQNKRVLVEFVSANPTGPMHIGNARGGAIGDCLAEVLNWAGFYVEREFYLNDAGNQIEKFKRSLSVRYLQLFENGLQMPEDSYKGDDIIELAKEFASLHGDGFVNVLEEQRQQALVEFALPRNVERLKNDLKAYRVLYDNWFRESSLYEQNKVDEVVNRLTQLGHTFEKDGAVWFAFSRFGGEKDEVLIRENGFATYFAADVAYHYNKFVERKFDVAINVWGADHHGHVARLKGALKALGVEPNALKIVLMQLVRLVRKGETVKLSKRSGKAITLATLLDEVSVDAARFFFNLREANSHFEFDLDLAVSQSSNNPVYYVQYAYARACQLLKKVENFEALQKIWPKLSYDFLEVEKTLIKAMVDFEAEVEVAALNFDPSVVAKFAVDLANRFHKFYSSVRILGAPENELAARVLICAAAKVVLENVFKILKVEARQKL